MATANSKCYKTKRLKPIPSSQREVPGRKYSGTKTHDEKKTDDELNPERNEQQDKEAALRNKETDLNRRINELQFRETELQRRETELKKKDIALKNEETELMNKGRGLMKRESDIREKETKLKYKEAEVKNMDADIKTTAAKINYKEAEVRCSEADLKYKEAEMINKEAEVKHREAEVKKNEVEFQKKILFSKMLHESEIKKLRSELASKKLEITKLTTDLEDAKNKMSEIEKLRNELLSKQSEINKLSTELEDAMNKIKDTKDELALKLTEKETELEKIIFKLTTKDNELQNKDSVIARKDEELKKTIAELKKHKNEIENKVEELQRKDSEIDELHNKINAYERLRKVIGAKINDGNPDIAVVIDMNRPTKLAEKYAELYDNDWTDAYEEIEMKKKIDERKVIETLLSNLKDVYDFCRDESKDYEANIKKSALAVSGTEDERPTTPNLSATSRKLFVDLRKTFAPFLVDDVFKKYKKKNEKKLKGYTKTTEYIKTCVEICWLMSVQDPPVVLDIKDPKGPFDGDKYRTYTKSGKTFDFIVWPPMYLKESGPLLEKGVAQAK